MVDNLHPEARFDRLRFIFETNIDLIEIIKDRFKDTYTEAFRLYKSKTCPKFPELLKENTKVVKRLYPSHQPEVFLRL